MAARSRLNRPAFLAVTTLCLAGWGAAEASGGGEQDIVTVLGLVRGDEAPLAIGAQTVQSVRPRTLDGLVQALPAVSLATNSRGEGVAAVRGRGEREAMVTLEGVPLNDPWDGRVNFSVVPAGLVSGVSVAPEGNVRLGSGSVLAFDLGAERPALSALAEIGSGDLSAMQITAANRGVLIDAYHTEQSGFPTPAGLEEPPAGTADMLRLNSDRRLSSVSGALRFGDGEMKGGAFAMLVGAQYGVPPEAHLDAGSQQARFWRVPKDDRAILGAYGSAKVGSGHLRARVWRHQGSRAIDMFADETYAAVVDEERSKSAETGGAMSLDLEKGRWVWAGGGDLRHAEHTQKTPGGERFARVTGAFWSEASGQVGAVQPYLSVRYERFSTQASGGRPEAPELGLLTGQFRVSVRPNEIWELRGTFAQLGRLPGQRELYGEQLGRFVINPDLEPERRRVISASAVRRDGPFSMTASVFAERSTDEIGQQVIIFEGQQLRQRINQDGFDSIGADFLAAYEVTPSLRIEGHGMALSFSGVTLESFPTERPRRLGELRAIYDPAAGFGGMVAVRHRGEAFSLGPAGERVELEPATVSAAEVHHGFAQGSTDLELFLRVENGFDTLVEPQLGLPAPGRMIRAGIRLSL